MVRTAIIRYRNAILTDATEAAREPQLAAAADDLYRALWAPLVSHLEGATRIYVVPDGILNIIPLRALKDGGRYLIERQQLVQLGSSRDLFNTVVPPRGRALIVGAPDYGLAADARAEPRGRARTVGRQLSDLFFTPLPGALEESKRVAAIMSPTFASELLSGARATETAVMRARAPAVLHLATHGFFLDDATRPTDSGDPLQALSRSGLALANANLALRRHRPGGADDGILTALEAVSLDLRGTGLVVLSACDTGLGQVETGDGVYGLARAFHEAGSQTVMATLWPVADEATSEFMQRFYRRIVRGEAAQRALQATQIEFIQGGRWQDPRFWAPFVLTGR